MIMCENHSLDKSVITAKSLFEFLTIKFENNNVLAFNIGLLNIIRSKLQCEWFALLSNLGIKKTR